MTTESSRTPTTSSSLPPRSTLLTFLIADFRGYTSYTADQGDEAAALLTSRFADFCHNIVTAHDGEVIELRGDEALAIFSSARQALRAAVELRGRFPTEIGQKAGVDVGIGLDAGDAVPVKGGYRTGALNLAARLQSLARGEAFASETVITLAGRTTGLAFIDRGEVTVNGRAAPVRVFEVAPEGEGQSDLPRLQPLLDSHPTNLPDEPTPFIGRQSEIEEIAGLFRDPGIRLVTLTGAGGTGKSRLALRVGTNLLAAFQDGVFVCDLVALTDPDLVPAAIGDVLGIKETGTDVIAALVEHLRDKHLLLVLDTFEHVLAAAAAVSTLLNACRGLHILVASRIPLHLSREQEHAVPPLTVPDPRQVNDVASLSQYESVALFIQRAKAAKASFAVTDENARAVAEICSRLDGLPLAIELAAPRIKLLPPQALLQQLSRCLHLLTGGAKDRPTRQQTLRGAIDWSHALLTEEEQVLFARLSVFAGGCTLEAAEAVCNSEGNLDVLEGTVSLVDKSLLRSVESEEARCSMLETIREYASEKLAQHGEADAIRRRHAQYFVALIDPGPMSRGSVVEKAWMARVERDYDNLRAALQWAADAGEGETALELALRLQPFWMTRGYFAEAERCLDDVLAKAGRGSEEQRASAYGALGWIAHRRGKFGQARSALDESSRLSRESGDPRRIAQAMLGTGAALIQQGDDEQARDLLEQSLTAFRELDSRGGVASTLHLLGEVALNQGDYGKAMTLTEESIALSRERGDTDMLSASLENLARAVLSQGNVDRTEALWKESLRLAQESDALYTTASALAGLAMLSARRGEVERAAQLHGAAQRLNEEIGLALSPPEQAIEERFLAPARSQLDALTWAAAENKGRAMTVDRVVAYALEEYE